MVIAIGLGLAGGANQPILAVVAFVVILGMLYLSKLLGRQQIFRQENRLFVNIQTDQEDIEAVAGILSKHLMYVELKRMDTLDKGMDLSFVCRAKALGNIAQLKAEVLQLSPSTRLSVIDQPDLIV